MAAEQARVVNGRYACHCVGPAIQPSCRHPVALFKNPALQRTHWCQLKEQWHLLYAWGWLKFWYTRQKESDERCLFVSCQRDHSTQTKIHLLQSVWLTFWHTCIEFRFLQTQHFPYYLTRHRSSRKACRWQVLLVTAAYVLACKMLQKLLMNILSSKTFFKHPLQCRYAHYYNADTLICKHQGNRYKR